MIDTAQITKMLQDAFEKSPEAQSLWAQLQDKGAELAAARARAFEYSDKAESLAERIEAADIELSGLSTRDISFEKLSIKRKALRDMRGDHADLGEWIEKINDEITRLVGEQSEIKLQLDNVVQFGICAVYDQVNGEFQKLIETAETLFVAWQDAHNSFRTEVAGTQNQPRLSGKSRIITQNVRA